MPACTLNFVVVHIVVDVSRTLENDVTICAAGYDVFLYEGGWVGRDVDTVAYVAGYFVEEDVWVCTPLHFYAEFIVKLDCVARNDWFVFAARSENTAPLILADYVEF